MIATPWGPVPPLPDEGTKRAKRDLPSELTRLGPRQRIYAAMVAVCFQRRVDRVTVDDLLATAGLSRTTFYEHFTGKEQCFLETLEATFDGALTLLESEYGAVADPEARARGALSRLFEMAARLPAAARFCVVEPFVAGGEALEAVDVAFQRFCAFVETALAEIPGHDPLPEELTRPIVSGIFQVLFRRLTEEASLEGLDGPLWEWILSYEPPPTPLRFRGWRPKPPPPGSAPPYAQSDPAERIIRGFASAVAEKGYRAATISEIASRASVSQRTIYQHFPNKDAILDAALESSGMQVAAAVVPAIRRSSGWPHSVRAALGALTRYYGAEPDFARLRLVEIYGAGLDAIRKRDEVAAPVLASAYEEGDAVEPSKEEAILGALFGLYYDWIRTKGTESLPEAAPLSAYIALAPVIGAEQACEVANGDGR